MFYKLDDQNNLIECTSEEWREFRKISGHIISQTFIFHNDNTYVVSTTLVIDGPGATPFETIVFDCDNNGRNWTTNYDYNPCRSNTWTQAIANHWQVCKAIGIYN